MGELGVRDGSHVCCQLVHLKWHCKQWSVLVLTGCHLDPTGSTMIRPQHAQPGRPRSTMTRPQMCYLLTGCHLDPTGSTWSAHSMHNLEQVRVLVSTGSTMTRRQMYHAIPKPKVYNDLKWDIYNDALNLQRPNERTSILKQASK